MFDTFVLWIINIFLISLDESIWIDLKRGLIYYISYFLFLPLHKFCDGVLWSLLSVCVCVYYFVCKQDLRRTKHPIFIKFDQIMYNYNWKVKFKDGLCQLIFKATVVENNVRNVENQPLQEWFSKYWYQISTVDVKLKNLKDIKALWPWYQKCPLKGRKSSSLQGRSNCYFSKIVKF